jgi:hypothetical protein
VEKVKDKFRRGETRYKTGKYKNWLKTLTISLPPVKEQGGIVSEVPIQSEHGVRWLQVPNYVGVKKAIYYFDYTPRFFLTKVTD